MSSTEHGIWWRKPEPVALRLIGKLRSGLEKEGRRRDREIKIRGNHHHHHSSGRGLNYRNFNRTSAKGSRFLRYSVLVLNPVPAIDRPCVLILSLVMINLDLLTLTLVLELVTS